MGKLLSAFTEAARAVFGLDTRPYTAAVVASGGSSSRMGEGISKQMLRLGGIPVVVHTLLAFERAETVDEIVVVAKADELPLYEGFQKEYGISKLKKAIEGGESRQESVKKGFAAISEKARFVAIHDGARCLITPCEIDRVNRSAYKTGAATAAHRVNETVKSEKSGLIYETLDRDHIWLARTPQVFGTDLYRAALAIAERDGISVTDDCALVEHIDYRIQLVACSSHNMKITTPEDIPLATAILAMRREEEGV